MRTRKLLAGVLVAGALVVAPATVAVAADGGGAAGAPAQAVRYPRLRQLVRAAAGVVVKTVGGTPQELRDYLRNGGTVAGYAADHGHTAQDAIDALVKAANARLDRAVANGKIPSDRADAVRSRLPDLAARFVNHVWGARPTA
jgi:hypothetical protein